MLFFTKFNCRIKTILKEKNKQLIQYRKIKHNQTVLRVKIRQELSPERNPIDLHHSYQLQNRPKRNLTKHLLQLKKRWRKIKLTNVMRDYFNAVILLLKFQLLFVALIKSEIIVGELLKFFPFICSIRTVRVFQIKFVLSFKNMSMLLSIVPCK